MSAFARFSQRCLVSLSLACLVLAGSHAQDANVGASIEIRKNSAAPLLPAALGALPFHIDGWIARLQHAAQNRSYVGTLVVSSSAGAMSSARITHTCSEGKQLERIESLTGVPRTTYRWGHEYHTFLPETRTLRRGRFDSAGGFLSLAQVQGTAAGDFYRAVLQGTERVAGMEADVVWFKPGDSLRFGYRIWSEHETGLVLKMQTLQASGAVLEQVAFSEIDLQAAVPPASLRTHMQATHGYQVVEVPMQKVPVSDHAWVLRRSVPGFVLVNCYAHNASPASKRADGATLQCTYSDGLASVSLFMEPYGRAHNGAAGNAVVQRTAGHWSMGATHTLAQRVGPSGWLTLVGEVPLETLLRFAEELKQLP